MTSIFILEDSFYYYDQTNMFVNLVTFYKNKISVKLYNPNNGELFFSVLHTKKQILKFTNHLDKEEDSKKSITVYFRTEKNRWIIDEYIGEIKNHTFTPFEKRYKIKTHKSKSSGSYKKPFFMP